MEDPRFKILFNGRTLRISVLFRSDASTKIGMIINSAARGPLLRMTIGFFEKSIQEEKIKSLGNCPHTLETHKPFEFIMCVNTDEDLKVVMERIRKEAKEHTCSVRIEGSEYDEEEANKMWNTIFAHAENGRIPMGSN